MLKPLIAIFFLMSCSGHPLPALQGRRHLPDLDRQPRARHEEEDGNQGLEHAGDFDGNYLLHQETQVECDQVSEDPLHSQSSSLLSLELFRHFYELLADNSELNLNKYSRCF